MDIEIGDDTFTKKPNILEEIAYRDTWGKGADSYISVIYERLVLMRDLLAEDGSIYVHMGPNVNHLARCVLDEVFSPTCQTNEIIWRRTNAHSEVQGFGRVHDSLLFYSKSANYVWNQLYEAYDAEYVEKQYRYADPDGRRWKSGDPTGAGATSKDYHWKGKPPIKGRHWAYSKDKMEEFERQGRLTYTGKGSVRIKQYLDEMPGQQIMDVWDGLQKIHHMAHERVDYPTQKPEALLERIIRASSNENDIVADFFCGSGTTAAVAEKLGRKWIVSDLGKFAIHTTRKRMIGVQRERKAEDKTYRAFEILNLGKYERQHFVGVNPNLREEEQRKQLEEKEGAFLDLILTAYKAEKTDGLRAFHGKKAGGWSSSAPSTCP
jgi:adenine specific DNA methylase Mod